MHTDVNEISFDEFDEINFPRPEESDFSRIADTVISRRSFLGSAVFGASALVVGSAGIYSAEALAASRLGFKSVPANSLDTVTVPEGYNWHLVAQWGDGLWSKSEDFDKGFFSCHFHSAFLGSGLKSSGRLK